MKRVIICADGTWNVRDQLDKKSGKRRPTNVTKVARAIRARAHDGTDQVVYYHDGVGTGRGLDRITGGAFGHGMEDNIRELYRFIVYNYVDNDELYFFGFSRGAFTVRSLAGFLRKLGLLQKDDDYYVPDLYRCYESNKGPGSKEWERAFHNVRDPQPCPPIRFVGVWDTVGALGAPGLLGQVFSRGKYKYHDVGLNDRIQNAFHALSIDERRRPFAADIWKRPAGWEGSLVQAWFPGVHSNVGGGYANDGVANEALHWLVEQAERLGLEFDDQYLAHFRPCFDSALVDSMTMAYRLLIPYERQLGEHAADGEAVHQAVLDRMNLARCKYAPENLRRCLAAHTVQNVDTTRVPRGTPCG